MPDEQAIAFACAGEQLVGIVAPASPGATRAVLIVVGGPQYRAGSHRQFTLLARRLAAAGIPSLRFDYRGMGDSEGAARSFADVGADLGAAIDALQAALPAVREVVLWGLCDAAAAALFYAHGDARVRGLVLLNPWARSAAGHARATLRHYYLARLRDPALWRKVLGGRFAAGAALRSLAGVLGAARARAPAPAAAAAPVPRDGSAPPLLPELHARLLDGMQRFGGRVLFILSGADLTAQEFLDMTKTSRQWPALLAAERVQQRTLAAADHTFSCAAWRDQVADWTAEWVGAW